MANNDFIVKNGLTVNGSFTANSTVVNAADITATSVNAVTLSVSGVSVTTIITGNSATAYTNAVAFATSAAGNAYTNAVAFATSAAGTAYTNAATFSSNATNITSGTLPTARLDANVINTSASFTITGVHTYNANVSVTGTTTLNGNSSVVAARLFNASESVNVSATAATGTVTYRVSDQAVLFYTSNATANWTPNVSFGATTTLNTAMSNGQSISIAFLVTQGATAYFSNSIAIDGSTVTPRWQGGTTPTAGNASGIDSYVYNIIKTGTSTYTVLASLTQFK